MADKKSIKTIIADKIKNWGETIIVVSAVFTLLAGGAVKFFDWSAIADSLHVATTDSVAVLFANDSAQQQDIDTLERTLFVLSEGQDMMKIVMVLQSPALSKEEKEQIRNKLAFQKLNADSLLRLVLFK